MPTIPGLWFSEYMLPIAKCRWLYLPCHVSPRFSLIQTIRPPKTICGNDRTESYPMDIKWIQREKKEKEGISWMKMGGTIWEKLPRMQAMLVMRSSSMIEMLQ